MLIETKQNKEIKENIISALEEAIGVPREYWEIKRSKETTELEIRQIYCFLLRTNTKFTTQYIADIIGYKHHTSVLRTTEAIEQTLITNEKVKRIVNEFKKEYEQRNS